MPAEVKSESLTASYFSAQRPSAVAASVCALTAAKEAGGVSRRSICASWLSSTSRATVSSWTHLLTCSLTRS